VFEEIIFYFITFGLGFIFQSLLPGKIRMVLIYPLSLLLGILTIKLPNYFLLAFNVGMISRAVAGGYWMCVALETALLAAGLAIGILAVF
jgi:hypothetical protein